MKPIDIYPSQEGELFPFFDACRKGNLGKLKTETGKTFYNFFMCNYGNNKNISEADYLKGLEEAVRYGNYNIVKFFLNNHKYPKDGIDKVLKIAKKEGKNYIPPDFEKENPYDKIIDYICC